MPLVEMKATHNVFTTEQKRVVARETASLFIESLGVRRDNLTAQSICRVLFLELNEHEHFCGDMLDDTPFCLQTFYCPKPLEIEQRERLITASAECVNDLLDIPITVWGVCLIVPDGHWASNGQLYTWHKIKRHVARGEIARRKQHTQSSLPKD